MARRQKTTLPDGGRQTLFTALMFVAGLSMLAAAGFFFWLSLRGGDGDSGAETTVEEVPGEDAGAADSGGNRPEPVDQPVDQRQADINRLMTALGDYLINDKPLEARHEALNLADLEHYQPDNIYYESVGIVQADRSNQLLLWDHAANLRAGLNDPTLEYDNPEEFQNRLRQLLGAAGLTPEQGRRDDVYVWAAAFCTEAGQLSLQPGSGFLSVAFVYADEGGAVDCRELWYSAGGCEGLLAEEASEHYGTAEWSDPSDLITGRSLDYQC